MTTAAPAAPAKKKAPVKKASQADLAAAKKAAELAKIIAEAEKKLGKGAIHYGSESERVHHLPFLEPFMNYATEGGAPFGRFMAEYGDESTGKTRQAYELMAQLQALPGSAEDILLPRIAYHQILADDVSLGDDLRHKHAGVVERLTEELEWIRLTFPNGGHAVYYNAEQQWDPKYAERIGIDTSSVLIIESSTIEHIAEMMQNLYAHYPMHVVDSTTSADSLLQQKQEVGKSLVGTDARQWKNSLRSSMEFFDPARNIGLLIHQMSTKVSTGGAQAASTRYLRHTSSCSIKFTRGQYLYRKDGVLLPGKEEGADKDSMAGMVEPDGVEVFAKIEKSRTCRPMRAAGLQFDFGKLEFTKNHELATTGLHPRIGILEKSGSWYKVAGEDKNIGQGLKTVYRRLEQDQALADAIEVRLMDFTGEV